MRPLCLVLLAGCSAWPVAGREPDCPGPDCLAATADLRALVDVSFSPSSEGNEPNDEPQSAVAQPLSLGEGVIHTGRLDGTGWDDSAPERVVACPTCTGGQVELDHPYEGSGDYVGDVDWLRVRPVVDGVLCFTFTGSAPVQIGGDALLFADSDAGPVSVSNGEGSPIGLGQRLDGVVEWSAPVQADGYLVLFGAFTPDDPELTVNYEAAVSLVAIDPDGGWLCPLPPA